MGEIGKNSNLHDGGVNSHGGKREPANEAAAHSVYASGFSLCPSMHACQRKKRKGAMDTAQIRIWRLGCLDVCAPGFISGGGKRVWRKTKGTKEQREEKRRTSGGIKVGYPMKDDAVQEQRRGVDLHGAAQEAVEDPNVPAVKAGRRVSISSTRSRDARRSKNPGNYTFHHALRFKMSPYLWH